jgi:hypothetical protein
VDKVGAGEKNTKQPTFAKASACKASNKQQATSNAKQATNLHIFFKSGPRYPGNFDLTPVASILLP